MTTQKIHEPFVIGLRNAEQRKHLLVTASRAFKPSTDQMLHLVSRDRPLGIGPRHTLPEISEDHILERSAAEHILRQDDIGGLYRAGASRTQRRLHNVL